MTTNMVYHSKLLDCYLGVVECQASCWKMLGPAQQECGFKVYIKEQSSGYATWFMAGGAMRIALRQLWQTWKLRHYDVIDDVITRKL